MINRNKTVATIFVVLTVSLLMASIPSAKAQFVIAEWDYPDEYGQGIELFAFYENSTGSWVSIGSAYEYDQSYIIEWSDNASIKLRCYTFFNSTFTGADNVEEGKNYQQHSVIVTSGGAMVFSQQNFTYYSNSTILAPMWYYGYEVILNFLPQSGQIYTVVVTYEIWW